MENCIFCKIIKGEIPCKKIYEDEEILGFLDINPHGDGHILLIPKNHRTDVYELEDETFLKIHRLAKNLTEKILKILKKEGINICYNYGSEQEIKHFHLHLIPEISKGVTMEVEEVYEILKKEL